MKPWLVACLFFAAASVWAQSAGDYETVVHGTALASDPVSAHDFPAATDVLTGEQLRVTGQVTLQGALQALTGATLGDEQGNPFQTELTLRGFKASPVTGLSQGVGVFVDGVRVNEPDAEEVNFDLIPLEDVERVEVIRGPNALFGRNSLAGAIEIITRRGRDAHGLELEAQGGSFALQRYVLRSGVSAGPWDVYLSGLASDERGYRAQGVSHQARLFAKAGYTEGPTDMTLSYQLQRDALDEPGSLPLELYRVNPSANFTSGDAYAPALQLLNFNLSHDFAHGFIFNANAYGRFVDSTQLNANFTGPDTSWANRTRSFGLTLQAHHQRSFGRWQHHFTLGAEYVHNDVRAGLTDVQNASSLADCLHGATPEDCPLRQRTTELWNQQNAPSGYAVERLGLAPSARHPEQLLTLTVGVRLDGLTQRILDLSPVNPGQASGSAVFHRFNPSAGLSYRITRALSVYGAYKEGFRAPAFLELTCARPDAPCVGLQAGVAPDPTFTALRPVVARAFELGASWSPVRPLTLEVSGFRTQVEDDIFSIAPTPTESFFQNIGATLRTGLEAHARWSLLRLGYAELAYSYTRATFENSLDLMTPRHPDGTERVHPGDELPSTPEHALRASLGVDPTKWFGFRASAGWVGPQWTQGDEANEASQLPGYFLLSLGAHAKWDVLRFGVDVSNVLNRRYATFGTWSNATGPVQPFLTPGEPLRVTGTLGVEL